MTSSKVVWRKAKASSNGGNCVEFAQLPDGLVGVRNSRSPKGVVLAFPPAAIGALIQDAKDGKFDDLA